MLSDEICLISEPQLEEGGGGGQGVEPAPH